MGRFNFDFSEQEKTLKSGDKTSSYKDERFWEVQKDKSGNGLAVIRFVPHISKDGNATMHTSYYEHFFDYLDGQKKKYHVDKCPTTIGKECPICERNKELWNSPYNTDTDTARHRKRIKRYISNVYIVKDPQNPENEGKVFLYKFGQKIMENIQSKMFLTPEQEAAGIKKKTFNPWQVVGGGKKQAGANFNLQIKMKNIDGKKMSTYDESTWDDCEDFLGGDEDAIETVLDKTFALAEFTDGKTFPTYDEVAGKLKNILGGVSTPSAEKTQPSRNDIDDYEEQETRRTPVTADEGDSLDADVSFFENMDDE